MIFLCHAYLTFECSTLLLEEDRLTVISMWSAKECGWSEIKVNASPKDQHWHCSAQRLQLSTKGLLSAFVVVPCLSGRMMKASILCLAMTLMKRMCVWPQIGGSLSREGGRGSQSSSLFNQDALPPSPPLCFTELHRSIGFYLNGFELTPKQICYNNISHTNHFLLQSSIVFSRILIFALFELHPVWEVGENEIGRHECNRGGCKQSRPGLFGS